MRGADQGIGMSSFALRCIYYWWDGRIAVKVDKELRTLLLLLSFGCLLPDRRTVVLFT